ncbi:hypothetical protein KYG_03246 [Acidovorax sp. NO-1]|uniref:hypothetical protein n=1 Tax=Acidovorax sp. NO-1 TaxID=512030 RepID=UPI00023FCF60|nr:hypothetical protein KYG_03246 [Acidovorax sp. NO-1]
MSVTSTARVGLLQRSQPMRPPLRSAPDTSRLSSVWSAGRYCAARARAAASDVLLPAHHQTPVAATSTSATRLSSSQPSARTARGARRGGARPAVVAPALKSEARARGGGGGGVRVAIRS